MRTKILLNIVSKAIEDVRLEQVNHRAFIAQVLKLKNSNVKINWVFNKLQLLLEKEVFETTNKKVIYLTPEDKRYLEKEIRILAFSVLNYIVARHDNQTTQEKLKLPTGGQ